MKRILIKVSFLSILNLLLFVLSYCAAADENGTCEQCTAVLPLLKTAYSDKQKLTENWIVTHCQDQPKTNLCHSFYNYLYDKLLAGVDKVFGNEKFCIEGKFCEAAARRVLRNFNITSLPKFKLMNLEKRGEQIIVARQTRDQIDQCITWIANEKEQLVKYPDGIETTFCNLALKDKFKELSSVCIKMHKIFGGFAKVFDEIVKQKDFCKNIATGVSEADQWESPKPAGGGGNTVKDNDKGRLVVTQEDTTTTTKSKSEIFYPFPILVFTILLFGFGKF